MSVVEDDSKLEKLKLAPNAEMQEDAPLTAEEEKHLAEAIVAKLRAPASPPGTSPARAARTRRRAATLVGKRASLAPRARRASPHRDAAAGRTRRRPWRPWTRRAASASTAA